MNKLRTVVAGLRFRRGFKGAISASRPLTTAGLHWVGLLISSSLAEHGSFSAEDDGELGLEICGGGLFHRPAAV